LSSQEVVFATPRSAAGIPAEVGLAQGIRSKTGREFEANTLDSRNQCFALFGGQRIHLKVALESCLKNRDVELRFEDIFSLQVAPASSCVSELDVEREGAHCVEVQKTDSLTRIGKSDIADLEVTVAYSLGAVEAAFPLLPCREKPLSESRDLAVEPMTREFVERGLEEVHVGLGVVSPGAREVEVVF
jgi:hypothetical protein